MTPTREMLVAAKVKDPDKWLDAIIKTCAEFEIDTPQRIADGYTKATLERANRHHRLTWVIFGNFDFHFVWLFQI